MKNLYFLLLTLITTSLSFSQEVIITGYIDSTCPSVAGRTLELYVDGTVDLTDWDVQTQSNGNGFNNMIDLSSLGTLTDAFVYLTNNAGQLTTEYGITTNVITSGNINSNGDDAFQVLDNTGAVIDRFGEDGVDGSGTAWEHVDSYVYRVDGVAANGGTFLATDFTYGGNNVLDNECGNFSAFVTLGSYSTASNNTPTVNITGTTPNMEYFEGFGPSDEETFSVSGINLTNDITVTAPTNFEVSLMAGGTFSNTVTVTQTAGTASATDVYIRLVAGLASNPSYTGDVTATSMSATDATLTVNGAVNPAVPQFSVFGDPVDALNYQVGGISNEDSIFVEGLFLTSDITVTAPANFEVSLTSGSGFSNSVTVPQNAGTVANTEVYVRLSGGLSVGAYSGDITISSSPVADETVALTGNVFGAPTNALVLTGVYDATLPGGTPKGIELFALDNIADLSVFGISSVANGGGSSNGNVEYNFPSVAVSAGDRIFLSTEAPNFDTYFGMMPTYTDGVVGINGDDSIELYEGATIIDTFGDVDTDGSGEAWEYTNGWAYRNNDTGPDGGFVIGNWTFSGTNVFNGAADNASATSPYPISTYTNSSLSVNNTSLITFNMFPNPTSNGTVSISSKTNESIDVIVFDMLGKQVKNETVSNGTLNVADLKSGIYLVNITQNNTSTTKKLIIN